MQPIRRKGIPLAMVNLGLWLLLMVACLVLVYVNHLCRQHYERLSQLEKRSHQLEADIGRYLLEQSAWGSLYRIEKVAAEQLGMRIPETDEMAIVEP